MNNSINCEHNNCGHNVDNNTNTQLLNNDLTSNVR